MDPDLFDRIDAAARRRHIKRAALLSLWAREKLAEKPATGPRDRRSGWIGMHGGN
ncbi:MAG: hypothetical protein JOZ05_14870 [Acetobacteraceae bacterium]|nr:hypothetical protein [Acetobacteraceae bacterium]